MAETNASLSDVYKKRARRRRRIFLTFVFMVLFAIAAGGAWAVFWSPIFQIQHVEIRGNDHIVSDDILSLVRAKISRGSFIKRLLGANNILAWPGALTADDLRTLPRAKQMFVRKGYRSRSVAATIIERTPFGIWCIRPKAQAADSNPQMSATQASSTGGIQLDAIITSAECFWFDDDGMLFERSPEVEGNLIPVVSDYSGRDIGLYSKVLPDEFIPNLISIFQTLSGSEFSIREVRIEDLGLQEIKVLTYDGPELYFSLRFPADDAAPVIQKLAQETDLKKLQYIDFRTENRAYYK